MKLSDIRGERSLDVMADVMELVEKLSEDDRFEKLVSDLKDAGEDGTAQRRALCANVAPLLRDYKAEIISVMASASGVPYEEYAENGEVVKDLLELLGSDSDALGFLASSGDAQA